MKKEILINFILTILSNIVLFIQNKYFIKYMGVEVLGMMKLFSQLLAYLNIIEMGIGSASTFALYKPLAQKNYNDISIIVNTVDEIYKKIGILLFGLGVLCIPIIPFFMDISEISNKVYFYWVLYLLNTVSTYLFIKYIILFTANQEFIYVRTVQALSKLLFQFLQIIFIIVYHSFMFYIILLISDNLFQWVLFKIHYKKEYKYIIKTKERVENIKSDIKNLFWHKVGGLIVFNTDLILISKFTSLEIVGIYASYQMILQILNTLIGILTTVLSPKIGRFIAKSNKNNIYDCFKIINIFYCFIATFFTWCTYILINDFIRLWLVEIVLLNNFTVKLICFNLWVSLFRGALGSFKSGAGFFDDIKSPIIESVINLVISIILGLKLGLDGVIIGTVISNIIVILIYKPILVFERCFNKNWKDYIKIYGNYLCLVIISMLICDFILDFTTLKNIFSWKDWIICAIKISLISLISIFLIFFVNKDFRKIKKLNKLYL